MPKPFGTRPTLSLVLSILYLRCIFKLYGIEADVETELSILYLRCYKPPRFSSPTAPARLSILYLRCHPPGAGNREHETQYIPFNSLFEMRSLGIVGGLPRFLSVAFNSLFEMRRNTRRHVRRADYHAFNSLFEMPAGPQPETCGMNIQYFQFSI